MPCGRESGGRELQGGPSPHTELRCVGPETAQGLQTAGEGSAAPAGQAMGDAVQASGRPTHTTAPRSAMGRSCAAIRRLPRLTSFHGAVYFQGHLRQGGPCLCRHSLQGQSPAAAAVGLRLLRGVLRPSASRMSEAAPLRRQALSCEAAPPCAALLPAASVHPGKARLSAAGQLSQALPPARGVRLRLQQHLREARHPAVAVHPRHHVVLSRTTHPGRVPLFTAVDPHQVLLAAAVRPLQVLLTAAVHTCQVPLASTAHPLQLPLFAAAELPGPAVVSNALLMRQAQLPLAVLLEQALPSEAPHPG